MLDDLDFMIVFMATVIVIIIISKAGVFPPVVKSRM